MASLPFVFSNQLRWRLSRHLSFWTFWYVFQVFLYSFTPDPKLSQLSFFERLLIIAPESLCYMAAHIFMSYMLMYWVIPRMVITGRYIQATAAVILTLFATAAISAALSLTVIEYLRKGYFSTPLNVQIYMAIIAGLRGGITIGGLAAAIKLMKYFYEKQQLASMLEQQKALAELSSLKSQLHPHFLFNTLNNIYAHAQDTAPVAADMLLGLSSLLRYILYTCNAPLVPLSDEIKMIHAYIDLEKKRYGDELDISVQVPADCENLMIAPLVMLPFIENCFKHGTSSVLENPWINLHVALQGPHMQLKLVNGVARHEIEQAGGIGIENVRRRLELIYPGKHQLNILEEDEVYIVNLTLQLSKLANMDDQHNPKEHAYEHKQL
ncbi:sensor histidine kinase [Dyadobacter sp. CY347]|uniref:sensor histidine kinase n=1 Tax=Dyadobacter sp. CY347 TaxID=2909336 RepID=UPI001F1D100F|nr:histidine kinase [Dyadobacter sp. CY347]MCF2489267.1 histidine kinase [Dyadobacter sp. CY347]